MVDEKVTEFHNFDPWDLLIELQTHQAHQQTSINTIAQAHNVNQQQVNDLQARLAQQQRQIVSLQAQINKLALNIQQKDSPNG